MVISFRSKDKRTRALSKLAEMPKLRLQFFLRQYALSGEAKQRLNMHYSKVLGKLLPFSGRVRNRCVLTNRAGSVFRHFRLSRIMLKDLASKGFLSGVRKSSW
jgi:ribosomal protein S14